VGASLGLYSAGPEKVDRHELSESLFMSRRFEFARGARTASGTHIKALALIVQQ
jgi:hypothetical protein